MTFSNLYRKEIVKFNYFLFSDFQLMEFCLKSQQPKAHLLAKILKFFCNTFPIFFCICVPTFIDAQTPRSVHFGIEEGLSSSFVKCIAQDQMGFLWVGTSNGLNRFDGFRFKTFVSQSGDSAHNRLSNSEIRAIHKDKKGFFWIATKEGLNYFDPITEAFKVYRHQNNNPTSLSNNEVTCILEDSSGSLWIGTASGLNHFDPKTEKFTVYQNQKENINSISSNKISAIWEDQNGFLWVGTLDGLNRFDPQSQLFTAYKHNIADVNGLPDSHVFAIREDKRGSIWVGTANGGITKFDQRTSTFKTYNLKGWIWAIYTDKSGTLLAGSLGSLNRYNETNDSFEPIKKYPEESHINSIFEDRSGLLWIGSPLGLTLLEPDPIFKVYKNNKQDENSLNDDMVWSIHEDPFGKLWIGTLDGGLNVFNPRMNTFKAYIKTAASNSISSNYITSILYPRHSGTSGMLWIGTREGFNRFNPKTETFTTFKHIEGNDNSLIDNRVISLYEDLDGTIWIGTSRGLSHFYPQTNSFTNFQFNSSTGAPDDPIISILKDKKGILWLCTFEGLKRFDPKNNEVTSYRYNSKTNSLSSNVLLSVIEDSKGLLWMATSAGLNSFDQNSGLFQNFSEKDGLPANFIYGILEDAKGNLWLSTRNGICRFTPPKNGKKAKIKNFDLKDGLPDRDFNSGAFHKGNNGVLYLGSAKGVVAFHPDSVKDNAVAPPIVITDFQVLNKPVPFTNSDSVVTLSYKQNFFSFEFAALNFKRADENEFAYQLVNLDKDWISSGTRRIASYTYIPPGEYTFRVKGSNDEGVWNEKGTSIKIIVLPPWWMTWWFRLLIGIAFAGGVISIFQFRTRNIRVQNLKLKMAVAERTKELINANEKLEESNKELTHQREEIAAQNEELVQSQEEIAAQRDLVGVQKDVIERQNKTLESEVAKRTIELTEQNQQLEQFAFISSHNLRAPVSRILGLGNLLSYSNVSAEERSSIIEKITHSTKELDMIVKDLAQILDIKKGIEQAISSTNLQDEITLIRHLLENEINSSGASVTTNFSPIENIRTVTPYLRSIFFNLIGNAIKYRHPDRKPEINITSEIVDDFICFTFSDNGVGIDLARDKTKLFKLYSRFHFHVEGKGMGLFLVKTQVDALGGKIEVESIVSQGTVFRVYLKEQ
jgi:ligand-binding sensor domain-containing protein/signal transduction histidine kinase